MMCANALWTVFFMRMGKSIVACLAAGSLCLGAALITADAEQHSLSQKLIRLHVIAASDSEEDQGAKLRVRDAVLASLPSDGWKDQSQAEQEIRALLPDLTQAASEELRSMGMDHTVKAELKLELYPTRYYDTFSLPAGEYLSLRIIIGEGQGKNWWCVVYPALCFGIPTEDAAAAGFSDEEISLITEDTASVRLRFRLLEILCRVRIFVKNEKQ